VHARVITAIATDNLFYSSTYTNIPRTRYGFPFYFNLQLLTC